MDPRNPAPRCEPCRREPTAAHAECEGWLDGFCGCASGKCLTDLTEPEEGT